MLLLAIPGFFYIWLRDGNAHTLGLRALNTLGHLSSNSSYSIYLHKISLQLKPDNTLDVTLSMDVENKELYVVFVRMENTVLNIGMNSTPFKLVVSNMTINTDNIAQDQSEAFDILGFLSKFRALQVSNLQIVKDDSPYIVDLTSSVNSSAFDLKGSMRYAKVTSNFTMHMPTDSTEEQKITVSNFPLVSVANFLKSSKYYVDALDRISSLFRVDAEFTSKNDFFKLRLLGTSSYIMAPIKKFSVALDNTDSKDIISIRELLTEFKNGKRISVKGSVQNNAAVDLDVIVGDVNIDDIVLLIPAQFQAVSDWLNNNLFDGRITMATKLQMDDIYKMAKDFSLKLWFSDAHLSYFDEHKDITNLSGNATIYHDRIDFDVSNAKIGDSSLYGAKLKLFYRDPKVPLEIKSGGKGFVRDFIHFIEADEIRRLQSNGIDIVNATGQIEAEVDLMLPLALDLNLQTIKIAVAGKIRNSTLRLFGVLGIDHGDFAIDVTKDHFRLLGESTLDKQRCTIEWMSYFGNNHTFHERVSVNAVVSNNGGFKNVFGNKIQVVEGRMPVNLVYVDQVDAKRIILLQLNMDDAKIFVPDLGINKAPGVPSSFNAEFMSTNDENWRSRNMKFIAKDFIDITADMEISQNFKEVYKFDANATYTGNKFRINYFADDSVMNVRVVSPRLDLSNANILDIFSFGVYDEIVTDKKQKERVPSKALKAHIDVSSAIMKQGIVFKDIRGNITCMGSNCHGSSLSMNMNDIETIAINFNSKVKPHVWDFKINNAAMFLKAFDMYQDMEGGALTGKVRFEKRKGNELHRALYGSLNITDFRAAKTPILAKLIFLTPFTSLKESLGGNSLLPFKNLNLRFKYSDSVFNIIDAKAKGSVVSAEFAGEINRKKGSINIHGSMTPHYTLNDLLGKLLTPDREGLISTGFTIQGSIKDPVVSYDALSIPMLLLMRMSVL